MTVAKYYSVFASGKHCWALFFFLLFPTVVLGAGRFDKTHAKALSGDADAQNRTGVAYELGLGVERDYTAAMKWFLLAAAQEHDEAAFNIGEMYEKGLGMTANPDSADIWYRKSCETGCSCACKRLKVLQKQRGQSASTDK